MRPLDLWNAKGRTVIFILAATSILSLLAEFYGLCSMRQFTLYIFLPSLVVLAAIAAADFARGNHRAWQGILVGIIAGLLAAAAYDIFRLPFVFARPWGISGLVPPMNLFKVFPRFGAMILGQPVEQPAYSSATQLLGWVYHFSNGATFGVMFVAAVGRMRPGIWPWAVLMAVGLELGMLFTPYPQAFGIPVTTRFVCVTLTAHLIFGVALGLIVPALAARFESSRVQV
jgi:hypothetical protein